MKRFSYVVASLLLCVCAQVYAKTPTLKEIVNGEYRTEGVPAYYPLSDGLHYLQKSKDGAMIIKYAYKTGKPVDTLFNAKKARECPFKKFDGYTLSKDEKKIMLYTDVEPIYRRSFKANYYTFEIKRNLVKPLSDNGKQQIATMSPNGRMVAFVRDNNIYLKKLDYDTESAVTTDGVKNKIINGATDWVYEEEFALTNTLTWSSDSEVLAFVKFDESMVPEYSMQMFEGMCPSLKQYALYPGEFRYKYPVAGEKNSEVGVYSYTVDTRQVKKLNVPLESEGYIPRICFTENAEQLAVMTFNRHQNHFRIFGVNPKSGVSKLLIQDQSKTWIDPDNKDYITFYPDFFVFASEKDGYRHLYQYTLTGNLIRQLTKGDWDVTAYLGYDGKGAFYYQAATEGPLYRSIYKVDTKGKVTKLSTRKGTNNAIFNPGCTYFVNNYSSVETPLLVTVNDAKGKEIRVLQDNKSLKDKLSSLQYSHKEFFTFKNEVGISLNGYIMKPVNFDPSKKYPVLMVQYSGPASQMVTDSWSFDWEQYLTANGYIVACVDGRGTGGRGAEFTKSIYLKLGILESQDQVSAAKYLASLDYVDGNNIAIWGWSFGGYNTLMSMVSSSGVFKAGVAIAPVTDWRYYDSIYTERYMRTPKENMEGYLASSPVEKAADFSGNLLIIAGTADDNVHYLNTLQFSEAMVQANKQFDMQIYTNRNHSIYGCNTRMHLYTKVCDFLNMHLK
ncbi:S9 family peptidase [Coprobacter tertius]|uniref:DPP IV N-terminal domain-containing protein n=1 Tax=Coprobacter tertius TaxID=2944915 RepID=A0ABT1MHG7_9BACT|nr:S9 family peptidase [Coprobacter tertius]MCP9611804.1 DPP IV N-terminal domain-containing protein [Coprobacter tertius]